VSHKRIPSVIPLSELSIRSTKEENLELEEMPELFHAYCPFCGGLVRSVSIESDSYRQQWVMKDSETREELGHYTMHAMKYLRNLREHWIEEMILTAYRRGHVCALDSRERRQLMQPTKNGRESSNHEE